MWIEAVKLFREYMGTGLIVIWFLVSVIYLWVHEKKKYVRILFIYMPVILLLLYFNPLFAELVFGVAGGEIYYRIIWLLPITIVIAYTCVCILGDMVRKQNDSGRDRTSEGKVKKGLPSIVAAVCLGGLIVISGSFI